MKSWPHYTHIILLCRIRPAHLHSDETGGRTVSYLVRFRLDAPTMKNPRILSFSETPRNVFMTTASLADSYQLLQYPQTLGSVVAYKCIFWTAQPQAAISSHSRFFLCWGERRFITIAMRAFALIHLTFSSKSLWYLDAYAVPLVDCMQEIEICFNSCICDASVKTTKCHGLDLPWDGAQFAAWSMPSMYSSGTDTSGSISLQNIDLLDFMSAIVSSEEGRLLLSGMQYFTVADVEWIEQYAAHARNIEILIMKRTSENMFWYLPMTSMSNSDTMAGKVQLLQRPQAHRGVVALNLQKDRKFEHSCFDNLYVVSVLNTSIFSGLKGKLFHTDYSPSASN